MSVGCSDGSVPRGGRDTTSIHASKGEVAIRFVRVSVEPTSNFPTKSSFPSVREMTPASIAVGSQFSSNLPSALNLFLLMLGVIVVQIVLRIILGKILVVSIVLGKN